MNSYYDLILEKAYEYGQMYHPDAPAEQHAAFANSVAYAVTRTSGGFGGPSMRQHLAARLTPEKLPFDEAIKAVEDCCYGELTEEHARMIIEEHCFDDAPEDLTRAHELLGLSTC